MTLTPKPPQHDAGRHARQQYLEQARAVIGEAELSYDTLYQRFAQNEWAALQLDEAVAKAALRAGHAPKQVAGMLHQSPYLQYQVHENHVPLSPMSRYVRATVLTLLQQMKLNPAPRQQAEPRQPGWELE
jgi:hypothetical protein